MFLDMKSKTLLSAYLFVYYSGAFLVVFYLLKKRIKTAKLERRLRLLERKHENEWILLEPTHLLCKLKAMQDFSSERSMR